MHLDGKNQYETEIDYRLAWAKTKLKKYGILENPSRGIWTLTDLNLNENEIDIEDINVHFNKE